MRERITFRDYVTQLKNNDFVVVAAIAVRFRLVERSHGTLNVIPMTKLCTNTHTQTRAKHPHIILYETAERD